MCIPRGQAHLSGQSAESIASSPPFCVTNLERRNVYYSNDAKHSRGCASSWPMRRYLLNREPSDDSRSSDIYIDLLCDSKKQHARIFESPLDVGNREVRSRDKITADQCP